MSHARPAGDFLHRDADDGVTRAPAVVRLPLLLTTLFPGAERVVRIEAGTVADVVDGLEARWPGMRDRLCDTTTGDPPPHQVFVEGRRARLDTPLAPGADVYVLTAVSGG